MLAIRLGEDEGVHLPCTMPGRLVEVLLDDFDHLTHSHPLTHTLSSQGRRIPRSIFVRSREAYLSQQILASKMAHVGRGCGVWDICSYSTKVLQPPGESRGGSVLGLANTGGSSDAGSSGGPELDHVGILQVQG